MPTAPYAKILVSVNSGANTSGGIEVPSGATIRFRGESVVGWLRQRWEIQDYPEGWATPSGWTLDGATGVIYSLAVDPSDIVLPDLTVLANRDLWGKWKPVLKVNEQLDDDTNRIGDLYDDTTIIHMLSRRGLRDIAARETSQFTTAVTLIKGWVRDVQRTLRVLERNHHAFSLTTNFTTTSATLADVTGAGGNTLQAKVDKDDIFLVEWELTTGCNNTGGGRYAITIPTGATIEAMIIGNTTGQTVFSQERITAGGTAATLATNAENVQGRRTYIRARIKMDGTNAGNITLQCRAATAAQTTTIYAGSTMQMTRLAA